MPPYNALDPQAQWHDLAGEYYILRKIFTDDSLLVLISHHRSW